LLVARSAMPNGNHGATTHRARHGEPQPVSGPVAPSDNDTPQREPTKKDLASWWRSFKRGNQRRDEETSEHPLSPTDATSSAVQGSLSDDQMTQRNVRLRVRSQTLNKLITSAVQLMKTNSEADPTMPEKGIFGVDLQTSIRYANVAISLSDAEGKSYVYGYVPIVVAKCGVFLKEKGDVLIHLLLGAHANNHEQLLMSRVFSVSAAPKNA